MKIGVVNIMEDNRLKKCPKCDGYMTEQVNRQLLDSSSSKRVIEYSCSCGCKITESQDYGPSKKMLLEDGRVS